MIALLNLIPTVVIFIGVVLALRFKKWQWAVGAIVVVLLYYQFQPSYMPKGEVQRSEIPAFDRSEGAVENRISKPVPVEDRQKARDDAIKQGLPFFG